MFKLCLDNNDILKHVISVLAVRKAIMSQTMPCWISFMLSSVTVKSRRLRWRTALPYCTQSSAQLAICLHSPFTAIMYQRRWRCCWELKLCKWIPPPHIWRTFQSSMNSLDFTSCPLCGLTKNRYQSQHQIQAPTVSGSLILKQHAVTLLTQSLMAVSLLAAQVLWPDSEGRAWF